jgi:hypothetical protein
MRRLDRLQLAIFVTADTPELFLRKAFGKDSVLAVGSTHEDETFAIVVADGRWYGLWFGTARDTDLSWSDPLIRPKIAYETLSDPHAASPGDPHDFVEALVADSLLEDEPERWPSGHLLTLLLSTLGETEREALLLWIGMGWPGVAQSLAAQERLGPILVRTA